jgi:predicted TIM-barrel fold metal-dependent hydrolase
MPLETAPNANFRVLPEITVASDTRDYLAHAAKQALKYDDYELIVDIDAHLQEGGFWSEIIDLLENDVLKQTAQEMMRGRGGMPLINMQPGMSFQSLAGRVPHQSGPMETTEDPAKAGHRFVQIVRRTIDTMGLDYQVIFPTSMLHLGMNPMEDIEIYLSRAYCRWLTEKILPQDKRILGLIYLPFNTPSECEKLVKQYAHHPGIVGFTICAVRHKPVHSNQYMRLYSMIEETGKPLIFHAGPHWDDPSFSQLNRFISMHALSFVHYNLIHMTNWVINAMPERGLAWIPVLMQRLDHEVMMRQSEAPGLKRLPSEYMREMYYSSQPMERNDLGLLEATMKAMKAETQLLYSSDWPHWDFDPPSSVTGLPFLSDQAKRNILGLNAARLFNLPIKRLRPRAQDVIRQLQEPRS